MEKYYKRKSSTFFDEQKINEKRIRDKSDQKDETNVSDEINVIDEINERDDQYVVNEGDETDEIDEEDGNEMDEGDEKDVRGEIDVTQLPSDPGLRIPIREYDVNVRDEIRRTYIQRGPCQPSNHTYPPTKMGKKDRRFCPSWFNEYPSWLEYSIAKDAVFCFSCYLFKSGGGDSFVRNWFSNWKNKVRLQRHVGKSGSAHNQARIKYECFKNQEKGIAACLLKQLEQTRNEYRIRLTASIDCIRFLIRQGLAFRGHDESEDSKNQGNFLELLQFLCDHNDEIKSVALKNAPENLKLTSPYIQKDIVSAAASETIDVIINDIGEDGLFSILVDESCDISMKEQMSVILRYVKNGQVIERFIGIEHVSSTSALSLKTAIDNLFSRYNLSISRLRGQGYDGASNMRGEYNGLKALILNENSSAFYIHCFAHQLQLALVAVANKHPEIETFFHLVGSVLNVAAGSAKRADLLREKQRLEIIEALNVGELSSGRNLNQEITLKRAGDTRWGSHYNSLLNLIVMFSSTFDVIELITTDDTSSGGKRGEARVLLGSIVTFGFSFSLHLMKKILGITDELSKALQRKDQDIVIAMKLVKICKERLQRMRDNEWDSFLETVCSFCSKHNVDVPNMNDMFVPLGRSRRITVTNLHHFRVDLFYAVIDMQLQELNNRFSEINSDLLLCVACLCPDNSFSAFDKNKLIRLCKYYPRDFSAVDILAIEEQLETYIIDMRSDNDFRGLRGLGNIAQKLILTKKREVYTLLYKLVTLALILPVATATVERVFSAMHYVKNRLRNRIGDKWLNDSLILYIEKDVFNSIDNDIIIKHYQNMKTRREQL